MDNFIITNSDKTSRYSLAADEYRSDGSKKDLRAIHNLSEEKLKKTLDLGGMVMPSIAVTKDNISHEGFGNISILFDKDSIDPSKKDNNVYKRDAWTPMFPKVEYRATYDSVDDLYSDLSRNAYSLFSLFFRQFHLALTNCIFTVSMRAD